jgi:ADP-ribose pyrophosphatase
MDFKQIWRQWRGAIFTTLSVSFVVLDIWFARSNLYWVTGYALIVTIFIVFVQLKYHETPRTLPVPILQTLPPKNGAAKLRLSEILLREFDYAKETAAQAMNDRLTMLNYFLLSAGVVVAGIGVMVSKEGGYEFPYRDESIIALSLIFNVVGWVYFMNQVRLRQAWCESARAMNHIKQVFVEHCGYSQDRAKEAFRWSVENIPAPPKKMTVFYFSALLISILSAAAIGLASTILLGVDQVSHFYFIPMGLSLYHLLFQMSMYTALLEESTPPAHNPKKNSAGLPVVSSRASGQSEMSMPKIVELKEEQEVFKDFFKITVGRFRFQKFNEQMSNEVRRLCLDRGDSVAVVLFNRRNNALVLIVQFRYPVYRAHNRQNGWLHELVAGVVDAGETPEQAVRREILEEAGYNVENVELLARIYPSPGGTSERVYIYFAEVAERENGGGLTSEHEDIRVLELPVGKVYEMVEQGMIEDAKTLAGLLYAKERLDMRQ